MARPTEYNYGDKFSFLTEWFDFESAFHKELLLNYYPSDNTLDLFDPALNRIFLKRSSCDALSLKDFYVGNTVLIYGRQIKITDYADPRTKNKIGKTRQRTFVLVKPSAVDKIGEIINRIQDSQFEVSKIRLCQITQEEALQFYESRKGEAFLPFVLEHVASGPVAALELVGDDAVARWRKTIGPTDPAEARKVAPETLRAIYGAEKASNAFHGSASCDLAMKEIDFFFPQGAKWKPPKVNLRLSNSTCCVVKPHAIADGNLGWIISFIMESEFRITAMQSFYLTNTNAEEFLEVYKGVVGDFRALMMGFVDGPCVAMEIVGKSDFADVHGKFRAFVGPSDPDVARQIRPNTMRARFGVDKYKNAVHCTDLADDTQLELEYFFKILS